MKSITTDELRNLVESGQNFQLVDVREDDEVALGMVPGAKHIPLGQLPERFEELEINEPVYCICKGGVRSLKACDFLESKGIDTVNVEGGMMSWNGEAVS
ncbi:rhodanese-like domain-containing protein [Planomicrobium sp. CPCC 101079]|uniref:rhodanese-like domain-containing protein n=1 Tax=Planomicrobium sp. CPCC 101079 TaxID=2599618 RepID=UPI0011B66C6F|nr:rhodanese-like domain-containing protein [Planomicrobium sp. CPCC 101079]TWT05914.1 rhodanese-like domain-containing protein [Planomicrobium sp. CPCC 101079]